MRIELALKLSIIYQTERSIVGYLMEYIDLPDWVIHTLNDVPVTELSDIIMSAYETCMLSYFTKVRDVAAVSGKSIPDLCLLTGIMTPKELQVGSRPTPVADLMRSLVAPQVHDRALDTIMSHLGTDQQEQPVLLIIDGDASMLLYSSEKEYNSREDREACIVSGMSTWLANMKKH